MNALDDVSLTVEPGESFALVGHNGAGKSTALKCLARVVKPTSGRVQAGGRVVSLIELGVGFHPDLSGLENARFAAAIAGFHGVEARGIVDRAIEFAEIGPFVDTPVKRYSSGMYARLSFGIAASTPADVLIVDEILAVGDLAFQRKCYGLLRDLRQRHGVTLIFVSHNEWVLKEVCQRGVLLSGGRVIHEGEINSVIVKYHAERHAYSAIPATDGRSRMEILHADLGTADSAFPINSPMTVKFQVRVDASVETPVAAVALFDSESRLVWGAYSDENDLQLGVGRNDLEVSVTDVAALPGACRVQVFCFDRASPVMEDIRFLDIVVEGEVPRNAEHGVVHVPTSWMLQREAG